MPVQLPIKGSDKQYVVAPSKIIAVGLNYLDHVKESRTFDKKDLDIPKEPVIFAKTPNVLIGPGENIVLPAFLKEYNFETLRIDHEAELAMIIGKSGKNIPEDRAMQHVFGFTCFNDVSARNIQKSDDSGWFRGKSLDTFGPIGPVVVPREQIGDPQKLRIRCRLNGETVQESSTDKMIFSLSKIISFISRNMRLEEGDIIATGTPSGVSPLKHGDVVEIDIEGIGVLKNPVIEE
jgi:2-keto-4-pentenoate hydratase/2-oxohepta-3-ene-1,7-dioic acid hydratase in catechol pathway